MAAASVSNKEPLPPRHGVYIVVKQVAAMHGLLKLGSKSVFRSLISATIEHSGSSLRAFFQFQFSISRGI